MTQKIGLKDLGKLIQEENSDITWSESTATRPPDLIIMLSSSMCPHARGAERVTVAVGFESAAKPVALYEIHGGKVQLSLGTLPPKVLNTLQAILSKK